MTAARINLTIPADLKAALDRLPGGLNYSAVCADALTTYLRGRTMTQTAEPQTQTPADTPATERPKMWAVLELMGKVRTGGLVSEEVRFGATLGRIEIPQEDGSFVTQLFGGSSVYRLTPCTEEIARYAAKRGNHEPVSTWELKRALLPAPPETEATYPKTCANCGDQKTHHESGLCYDCRVGDGG